mmetsp:Transcript_11592/g.22008  ORF Transcript_11592/g.22008 Transcript_11592/m.22008 type:complete len:219 (-) Transcript_11592:815-1471(-)
MLVHAVPDAPQHHVHGPSGFRACVELHPVPELQRGDWLWSDGCCSAARLLRDGLLRLLGLFRRPPEADPGLANAIPHGVWLFSGQDLPGPRAPPLPWAAPGPLLAAPGRPTGRFSLGEQLPPEDGPVLGVPLLSHPPHGAPPRCLRACASLTSLPARWDCLGCPCSQRCWLPGGMVLPSPRHPAGAICGIATSLHDVQAPKIHAPQQRWAPAAGISIP